MWRTLPVSRDMSPSMMNVSAARSRITSSPSIRFSYIARARSRTSHAALKSSSGSASSPSSPSPSPSPSPASSSASASASASGLDASANKSTAGSSSSSSASPENDRILLVPFAAGSVQYARQFTYALHAALARAHHLPSAAAVPFLELNSAQWHSPITPFRMRSTRPPSPARLLHVFAIWRVFSK